MYDDEDDDSRRAGFHAHEVEQEIEPTYESVASGAKLRSAKARQATAFVKRVPSDDGPSGRVNFRDRESIQMIEYEDVSSQQKLRSTRSRQATAFVPKQRADDEDGECDAPSQGKRNVGFR